MNKMKKRLLSLALVLTMCITVMQVPVAHAVSGTASDIVSIGNNEKDGTKGAKYLEWLYGKDNGYAWCAVFVSWCANQAGVSTNVIPKTASVGVMRTGVLKGGGEIVKLPQAGDLVFYQINKNGSWGHVGLMTGAKSSVQGNLGHQVLHVAKPEDYCLGGGSKAYTIQYIRPNYSNNNVRVDEILPEDVIASVTTGKYDSLTQTSTTLRGSFTTTGARASECGMYIGTSEDNLKKLGSDSVNTYGTSMYYSTSKYGYPLEQGKTYYYQAYAIVNGNTYKGEVKSFTTLPNPKNTGVPAERIVLDCTSLTLEKGVCRQLTAATTPAGQNVTWSSSDTSVATVSSNGGIEARKAGTTTITAQMTYNNEPYSASCKVTVTDTKAIVTTKGADSITKASAIVRGEVTVSSGTVTECGMYIGKSKDSLAKLGSDKISRGTPFYYSTSKYGYPLTADTTYFYQAYAIVDGMTIWGDVKFFTTQAAPVVSSDTTATVVNTNGQYLAINNAPAASPKYSTQIGRIPPGDTVTVDTSKTSGSWYWVTYNGVSGYAYGKYLSLN